MSESLPARKTSGLAIASLVLGILGLVCFGLLSGIPAIICGHISRGRIKRSGGGLGGAGLALAGLILGYLSILATAVLFALALPAVSAATERAQATQALMNARQIHLAMQTMAVDGVAVGDKSLGYPADAGIATMAELKQALIKNNYLTAEDAERFGFDSFLIGNISNADPAETIVIRSSPDKTTGRYIVIFRKGGDGEIVSPNKPVNGQEPARSPAYLAP